MSTRSDKPMSAKLTEIKNNSTQEYHTDCALHDKWQFIDGVTNVVRLKGIHCADNVKVGDIGIIVKDSHDGHYVFTKSDELANADWCSHNYQ